MKFTINIECTPEEAREFLNLPDPAKIQEHMMAAMQTQMPDMPEGWDKQMQQWQDLQKMFWKQMTTPHGQADAKKDQK